MKSLSIRVALLAAMLAVVSSTAEAALIPVSGADLIGSRSGTTANQSEIVLSGYTSFEIEWDIQLIAGKWNYEYKLTFDGIDSVSHLSLAASDGFNIDNVFSGTTGYPANVAFNRVERADPPLIPTDLNGFKFDTGFNNTSTATYVLVTDKSPIWGSFFAKVRANDGARNAGWTSTNGPLDITLSSFDKTEWVPVPDTQVVIPEPTSILMMGLGLVGGGSMLALRRRRR